MQQKVMTFPVAANANSQAIAQVATQDDNQVRTIVGVWCNDTTKDVQSIIQLQGKNIIAFDDYFNSLLKEPFPCSVNFPAGVQIYLGLINGTAANVSGNLTIVYQVAN